MKRRPPPRRWIVLAALLAGGVVAWLLFGQGSEAAWIPRPIFDSGNRDITIQWDFRPVTRAELDQPPESHPGHGLAQAHCARCHLFPSPDQLPRDTWPFVLSWMANYLGHRNVYGPFQIIVDAAQAPDQPLVSADEFRAIVDYYLLFSRPEDEWRTPSAQLPVQTRFHPQTPPLSPAPGGLVTLAQFDEAAGQYHIGDATGRALRIHDRAGRLLETVALESEPVGVDFLRDGFRLTLLGDLMLDRRRGQVIEFDRDAGWQRRARPVVEGFHRLTQALSADLNQDGTEDLLLVGFGEGSAGKVSILWRGPDGASKGETVLLDHAGGLNAVVHDFDEDGRPDILLLTAQGQQELLAFVNEGNGRFRRELIAKQFAGFGFNHLAIADFNGDGRMDLVLVNGNNMEIRNAPTKPYHGVRIWENEGGLRFKETAFIPLPGALKAVAGDFDKDGDIDLAVICFYPDWAVENPDTFVYLENQGGYRFTASRLASEHWGHWISLTSADVDQDGYPDLILGGGRLASGVPTYHREKYEAMTRDSPTVLVLRNAGAAGR